MEEVMFTFRGKSYKGFMAASTEEYPHYYWCFVEDPLLIEDLGDCVSFKVEEDGWLQPSGYYPKEYHDLLQAVKALIEQRISLGAFTPSGNQPSLTKESHPHNLHGQP